MEGPFCAFFAPRSTLVDRPMRLGLQIIGRLRPHASRLRSGDRSTSEADELTSLAGSWAGRGRSFTDLGEAPIAVGTRARDVRVVVELARVAHGDGYRPSTVSEIVFRRRSLRDDHVHVGDEEPCRRFLAFLSLKST
jgi:hypothetical protein